MIAYEIKFNESKDQVVELIEVSNFSRWEGYGSCSFSHGKYLVVAGGTLSNIDFLDTCEIIDIDRKITHKLPRLNKKTC